MDCTSEGRGHRPCCLVCPQGALRKAEPQGCGTDRDPEEVGLIHGIEDDPAQCVVCVVEVLDPLVSAAGVQRLHGPLQRLGNDPDAIIGISMELAGPHA